MIDPLTDTDLLESTLRFLVWSVTFAKKPVRFCCTVSSSGNRFFPKAFFPCPFLQPFGLPLGRLPCQSIGIGQDSSHDVIGQDSQDSQQQIGQDSQQHDLVVVGQKPPLHTHRRQRYYLSRVSAISLAHVCRHCLVLKSLLDSLVSGTDPGTKAPPVPCAILIITFNGRNCCFVRQLVTHHLSRHAWSSSLAQPCQQSCKS